MFDFLRDLWNDPAPSVNVLILDENGFATPRQYVLEPKKFFRKAIWYTVGAAVLLMLVTSLLPLGTWVVQKASGRTNPMELSADRLAALQDSLEVQQLYLMKLKEVLTSTDSTMQHKYRAAVKATPVKTDSTQTGSVKAPDTGKKNKSGSKSTSQLSGDSPDQKLAALIKELGTPARVSTRPALPMPQLMVRNNDFTPASAYYHGLKLPAMAPVMGYITRGFEARSGHYGIDIALQRGVTIRSVGEGYVTFADWTHEGGYVMVIQHPGGYVSVYKHNSRLLKRVGDRVRAREAITMSGNTGEITTGPHLHFEIWHEGLAQDPRMLVIGW